jgi:hypothetical protein
MAAKARTDPHLPAAAVRAIAAKASELGSTSKQTAFATLIASGLTQAEAFRRAYESGAEPTSSTVYVQSSKLADNSKVMEMVQTGRNAANLLNASRGLQWREKIDDKLWDLVEKKDIRDADRLAAMKLAGSMVHVQAFAKAADAKDAAAANLTEAMRSFFSTASESGIVIDITAESLRIMQVVDSIAPGPDEWDGVHEGSD